MERQKMLNVGSRQILVRMNPELIEAIDEYARSESARLHIRVTRADAIRKAVRKLCGNS